jgi:hypothetical protein
MCDIEIVIVVVIEVAERARLCVCVCVCACVRVHMRVCVQGWTTPQTATVGMRATTLRILVKDGGVAWGCHSATFCDCAPIKCLFHPTVLSERTSWS